MDYIEFHSYIKMFLTNFDCMKNYFIFLIAFLFFYTGATAQGFKKEDTVVVFQISIETRTGNIHQYLPYKKKGVIHWVDNQNIRHKSVIHKMNSRFLMLDSALVYPSDIRSVAAPQPFPNTPFPLNNPYTLIPDSSNEFSIMTYYDYIILNKITTLSNTQRNNDPFHGAISPEKYSADLERKKQRRIEMFAALDSCPMHYGIKTNLVRDLINEINLTFELPVKRNFTIDLGVGVLYTSPGAPRNSFSYVISDITRMRGRNLCYFDHSYLIRKGFTFEVIPKFFLSKKKHLYLGPQLCVRYYTYKDKWIFVNADGSDYYHTSSYSFQSEKSTAVQLNAIFGTQTPQIKRFVFDAFVSFGVMYRGGVVSQSIGKTYYHEWTTTDNYDPPREFKDGGFSLSAQIGFKVGWRFGRAKLY